MLSATERKSIGETIASLQTLLENKELAAADVLEVPREEMVCTVMDFLNQNAYRLPDRLRPVAEECVALLVKKFNLKSVQR